jgi:hypothetical protein
VRTSVLALAYFNLKYGTFKLLAARWASARWQASTYYLAPSTKVEQLELGSTGKSELLYQSTYYGTSTLA